AHARRLCEKYHGEEHPETAGAMINQAALLHDQGQLDAADVLCRQALERVERLMGPEHQMTVKARVNLAMLCRDRHDFAAAEEHFRQALEVLERHAEIKSPGLPFVLDHYAGLLESTGRGADAAELRARAAAVRGAPRRPDAAG